MSDLTSMLKICVGRDYFRTLYPVFSVVQKSSPI